MGVREVFASMEQTKNYLLKIHAPEGDLFGKALEVEASVAGQRYDEAEGAIYLGLHFMVPKGAGHLVYKKTSFDMTPLDNPAGPSYSGADLWVHSASWMEGYMAELSLVFRAC
jgi:hypothetical protein